MVVKILYFGHSHDKSTWFIYEVLEALMIVHMLTSTNALVTNKTYFGMVYGSGVSSATHRSKRRQMVFWRRT